MYTFQKVKGAEHENVFGKKEIAHLNSNVLNTQIGHKKHNRNPSNYNYDSINNTQQNEKAKNVFKIGDNYQIHFKAIFITEKEEDLLNLLENEDEEQFSDLIDQNNYDENFENNLLNESDLLEELVSYNKSGSLGKNEIKQQNTQNPMQTGKKI
jgi:hypothetical protein